MAGLGRAGCGSLEQLGAGAQESAEPAQLTLTAPDIAHVGLRRTLNVMLAVYLTALAPRSLLAHFCVHATPMKRPQNATSRFDRIPKSSSASAAKDSRIRPAVELKGVTSRHDRLRTPYAPTQKNQNPESA